ncbi:MAG: hypothetical protein ABS40_06920 [Agrobacterium sp. SCN 61-19]|nr:MAG: hypothetical protein ABS40_06920 [Agrobacterium sp. SCN 61-19]
MTMVCCDTPLPRPRSQTSLRLNAITGQANLTAATRTLDERASHAADRFATALKALARAFADHRRQRLEQAALEALPFDLRKDLGWPAGDTND